MARLLPLLFPHQLPFPLHCLWDVLCILIYKVSGVEKISHRLSQKRRQHFQTPTLHILTAVLLPVRCRSRERRDLYTWQRRQETVADIYTTTRGDLNGLKYEVKGCLGRAWKSCFCRDAVVYSWGEGRQ